MGLRYIAWSFESFNQETKEEIIKQIVKACEVSREDAPWFIKHLEYDELSHEAIYDITDTLFEIGYSHDQINGIEKQSRKGKW